MTVLRTQVEFRSSGFPPEPGEEERINPGRWGAALARFLRDELTSRGLAASEPIAEDWGYCIPIENPDFKLWVGCGNYEEIPDGFLCFFNPSTPFVSKLFRRIDVRSTVMELADALDKILRSHPDVRDLRWWMPDEG